MSPTDIKPNNSQDFKEILAIIERSRENIFRAVNRELISMYWEIGQHISNKCKTGGWGKFMKASRGFLHKTSGE